MKKKNVIQPWHELCTEFHTWDDETLFHHILCSSSLQLGLDLYIHRTLICYADMGACLKYTSSDEVIFHFLSSQGWMEEFSMGGGGGKERKLFWYEKPGFPNTIRGLNLQK